MRKLYAADTLAGRLIRGTAANALGKAWIAIMQIAAVPVLISQWGVAGYGSWLMLTSVPTYLALSDFGFGSAGATEMTKMIAENDEVGAARTFQSVWSLVTALTSAACVVACVAAFIFNDRVSAALPARFSAASSATVLLLCIYSAVSVQVGLLSGVLRSVRRYALGTALSEFIFPIEMILVLSSALLGGGFIGAAAVMLVARSSCTLIFYRITVHHAPWARLGLKDASLAQMRSLCAPALGSTVVPLASALSVQGVLLAIGAFVSPSAAGTFGAFRAISRLPIHFSSIVSRAALPELTVAFAVGRSNEQSRLLRSLAAFTIVTSAAGFMLTSLGGPRLLSMVSHDRASISFWLATWMSLVATLQTASGAFLTVLLAMNKPQRFLLWGILFGLFSAIAPALFRAGGLNIITPALAAVELIGVATIAVTVAREMSTAGSRSKDRPTSLQKAA